MTLGQKIAQRREATGLRPKDVAAFVGVNPATYWKWEADKVAPSFVNRLRLAELFGVPLSSLQADRAVAV